MNNEQKILEMLTGLTEAVSKLSSGQVEMRDEMEARFSKLEATQTKQGEQLTRLEERVEKLDATQTKQGEQLTRLEERVEKLDATQARQGEQLTRLEERVEELDARSLKSAVLLETDIPHQLGLLFEGHKTMMEILAPKSRVEELEEEVSIHKGAIQALANRVSVLERAQ